MAGFIGGMLCFATPCAIAAPSAIAAPGVSTDRSQSTTQEVLNYKSEALGELSLSSAALLGSWQADSAFGFSWIAATSRGLIDVARIDAWASGQAWDHSSLSVIRVMPAPLDFGFSRIELPNVAWGGGFNSSALQSYSFRMGGTLVFGGLELSGAYDAFSPMTTAVTVPYFNQLGITAQPQGFDAGLGWGDFWAYGGAFSATLDATWLLGRLGEIDGQLYYGALGWRGLGLFYAQAKLAGDLYKIVPGLWSEFFHAEALARSAGGWADIGTSWGIFDFRIRGGGALVWFGDSIIRNSASWLYLNWLQSRQEHIEMAYHFGPTPAWIVIIAPIVEVRPASHLTLSVSRLLPLAGGWTISADTVSSSFGPPGTGALQSPSQWSPDWRQLLLAGLEIGLRWSD